MKKIIGGRDKSCDYCGGTMLIIIINGQKYYQCVDCGAMTKSFPLEEVKIIEGGNICANVMNVVER